MLSFEQLNISTFREIQRVAMRMCDSGAFLTALLDEIVVDVKESAGLDRATNTKFHSFKKQMLMFCATLLYTFLC